VPPELAWLAEVESSLDAAAESPAGALGLYQFMPVTAQRFGLRTGGSDDRTSPEKSARAAAQYLRLLHQRFGSWGLALAAYNAGEGRVGRILRKRAARTFDEIAEDLPSQTRTYVPKVIATLAVREKAILNALPPPQPANKG
jgi:membrane-bound lytic murein transglycosylase D